MKKVSAILLVAILYGCIGKEPGTEVIFHIKWANNKKFLIEQVPFNDERSGFPIDSAIAHGDVDSLVFMLPGSGDRLFKVTADEVNMSILFVTDAPVIGIYANYGNTALYSFQGSPASTSLQSFMARQDSIAEAGKRTSQLIDSLEAAKDTGAEMDSLRRSVTRNLAYFLNQYKNFEDTVHSPASFMALYNNVDFGNDYAGLKKFIVKAAHRFQDFQPIQILKAETLDMVKIFEEEYNVGDTLPFITLPDRYGHLFSTASLKGKYYLIDFWSTWCPQCMAYNAPEKDIRKKFNSDVLELVSVAIDAEKGNWLQMIAQNQLDWPQLIDEKMWRGPAVKTLKFDSIPFNFLVSPQGRIIAKAIKPDSLLEVVSASLYKTQ